MQRTLAEIARSLNTDKTQSQGYIVNFERHFSHLRDKRIILLELGVLHGGSLLMWHEYFSKGLVVGLDLNSNPLTNLPGRMRFYQGSQDDQCLLDRIASECAPDGFDIVSQFDLGKRPENTYLAHPVICGGILYVRHGQSLLAYDIRKR